MMSIWPPQLPGDSENRLGIGIWKITHRLFPKRTGDFPYLGVPDGICFFLSTILT